MSDDIDFSDEGLGLTDAPAEETPEPDASNTVEDAAEAPPIADPVVDEAPVDAENLAPDPEEENYRQRYENLVPKLGEQGKELGELRKQLEQFMAAQQQPVEPEPSSPFQTYEPSTPQELVDLATDPDNAEYAFQFAATQAPEYLPHVLAEVQMYDPAAAERMRMEYYAYVAQQSAAPATQAYQERVAQEQTSHAVTQFSQSVEGWDGIKDEVASVIEEEPWLVGDGSAAAVQQGLRAAVRMVNQARAVAQTHAQAQVQQQGREMRANSAVESGTSGAAPAVTGEDPAQSIANAIFAEDERIRGLL